MSDTEKRMLRFPSMEGGDEDDSSEFYYRDYESFDDDSDLDSESDTLLNELFSQNERGDYVPYKPNDFEDDDMKDRHDSGADYGKKDEGIRAGELEAYNKAMEIVGGDKEFRYFPSELDEENNRKIAMKELRDNWGTDTSRNIRVARWFFMNFLNENLQKEAAQTGIGSHPLMILAFYKLAKQAEKFSTEMMSGKSDSGLKTLRFKGMSEINKKKLRERCVDLAARVYSEAQSKIIKIHGGISHG